MKEVLEDIDIDDVRRKNNVTLLYCGGLMDAEKNIAALHNIIRDLTEIESRLNEYIDTTMWISDPHGAGDRFVSILKGRFGLVWRICYEALPKTFSKEKIDYLGRIIRKERYFEE